MAKEQRLFNRETLTPHATPAIRPPIGVGAVAWRYTVLVSVEETRPGEPSRPVATEADIESLERLLFAHFGGVTILPISTGYGFREGNLELNKHLPFLVYAAAVAASEKYIAALQEELQEALVQELILIERHEVWLR